MSPRTRITNEQVQDVSFLSEEEFNSFFGGVVITGTENGTDIIQIFQDYFVSSNILVASSGTNLTTSSGQILVGATGVDNFSYETVPAGSTITIPLYQQMVLHDEFNLESDGILIIEGTVILEK